MKQYRWTLQHKKQNTTNLIDPKKCIQGYYLREDNTYVQDEDYQYTDYIPVSVGGTYQGHSDVAITFNTVLFYDENKNFISSLTGNITDFVLPNAISFIRVSSYSVSNGQTSEGLGLTLGLGSAFEEYYTELEVFPIYKSQSLERERESGQYFFRNKLSSNLKFIDTEYDYIVALDYQTLYYLKLEDLDGILPEQNFKFYRTDGKNDADCKIIDFKVSVDDNYDKILSSLNKKINLLEKSPESQPIVLKRRPIIQVYIPGDVVITNIMGGNYWEQPIQIDPTFDHADLTNIYKFENVQNIRSVPEAYANFLSTNITGVYDNNNERVAGGYKLETTIDNTISGFFRYTYHIVPIDQFLGLNQTWHMFDLYRTAKTNWFSTSINTLLFNGVNGETGSFYFTIYRIYVRYLTDLLNVRGTDTHPVPDEDIVTNNSNYRRIVGYAGLNSFQVFEEYVDYPTKFGKVPGGAPNAGRYYKEYTVSVASGSSNPIPISSSGWRALSLWFFTDVNFEYTEFVDGMDVGLRDSYPLHNVIQTLLREANSNVLFDADSSFSEFLYASLNPVSGSFQYLDFEGNTLTSTFIGNVNYNITSKSNIIVGNYDQPAKKLEVSLGQIFNILRDVFKCYWHIDNGKLRIEHISWYENGGAYLGSLVGTDLTELKQLRNNKSWGFAQNKWEYDKETMPSKYEYEWMDDVSIAFEGFPILVESEFVQEDRVEDISPQSLTTDIDFIGANPSLISKDGICMVNTVPHSIELYKESPESEYDGNTNYNNEGVGVAFTADQDYEFGRVMIKAWTVAGKKVIVRLFIGDDQSTSPDGLAPIYEKTYLTDEFNTTPDTFEDILLSQNFLLYQDQKLYVTFSLTDNSNDMFLRAWDNDGGGTREDVVFRNGVVWVVSGIAFSTSIKLYTQLIERVPFIKQTYNYNTRVVNQNGFLSWLFLHANFHNYGLPSNDAKINGEIPNFISNITRSRKQEVSYPLGQDIDSYKLIKTDIGDGLIKKQTVNLESKMLKAEIKHDPE